MMDIWDLLVYGGIVCDRDEYENWVVSFPEGWSAFFGG